MAAGEDLRAVKTGAATPRPSPETRCGTTAYYTQDAHYFGGVPLDEVPPPVDADRST